MSFERTIMQLLTESEWKLIQRGLESRIYEVYNWRNKYLDNPEIRKESDQEMEACYELIEKIKVK